MDRALARRLEARFEDVLHGPARQRHDQTEIRIGAGDVQQVLTALHDDGRLDILRSIRDGVLSLMEVYDAYQRKALKRLPTASTLRDVLTATRVAEKARFRPSASARKE